MIVRYPKGMFYHNREEKPIVKNTNGLHVLSKMYNVFLQLLKAAKTTLSTVMYYTMKRYIELLKDADIIISPPYFPINFERFEKFLHNINHDIEDSVRIIEYDIEGQPTIKTLYFDGKKITMLMDRTKETGLSKPKKGEAIIKYEGDSIEKKETDRFVIYNLKNNSKVYMFSYLK